MCAALAAVLLCSCANAQDVKKLPQPRKAATMSLMDALSQRASVREFDPNREVDDATLSDLLGAACGINRPESGRITAPSAINAQDIQVYVCRKDGAWLYRPSDHSLLKINGEDLRGLVAGPQEFVRQAPVCLVLVSDQTKFGERRSASAKFGAMDAGYVSENICLACTAMGLKTVPRAMMDAGKLTEALGLTADQLLMLNNPVGW